MVTGGPQVFCDVCSRGVTLNWEHIYRCRGCGRVVCKDCFRPELKLCSECEHDLQKARGTSRALDRKPGDLKKELRRRRLNALKWIVVGPLVILTVTGGLWLIYPKTVFWLTIATVHSLMSIFAGLARYPWRQS